MDAYSLPWFDPLEEAEARAEAVEDGLRAGADTLNEGSRADKIEGSRKPNASVYVAPHPSAVSYQGAPLALAGSLDKIPRSAGGAFLVS